MSIDSRLQNSRGFTLLEMLTVLAILGIILGLTLGTYIRAVQTETAARIANRNEENARTLLSDLRLELRSLAHPPFGLEQPIDLKVIQRENEKWRTLSFFTGANPQTGRTLPRQNIKETTLFYVTYEHLITNDGEAYLKKTIKNAFNPDVDKVERQYKSVSQLDLQFFDGINWVSEWEHEWLPWKIGIQIETQDVNERVRPRKYQTQVVLLNE